MNRNLFVLPLTLLLAGLLAIFIGERALVGVPRYVVSGFGIITVVAFILAALRIRLSDGERRFAAMRITLEYAICLVALLLYIGQMEDLGLVDGKVRTIIQVGWPAVLLLGLLPAIAMEMALFSMRRGPRLELWRIKYAGRGARIIALAIIVFAGLNYVSNKWNRKIDLSYFKTTKPGTSTAAMVRELSKPVRFVLFFPTGNDVLEQARAYTEELASNSEHATV
jgi:hypothetical protein